MSAKTHEKPIAGVAEIFARLWDSGKYGLSPSLARQILKLKFSSADESRARELSETNREGALSSAEQAELDSYVTVGDLLAILQSKARKVLKKSQSSLQKHG